VAVPTIYNVTLTNANTEYSQVLPAGTTNFDIQARTDVAVRFAFTAGKVAGSVAPYATMKAGAPYTSVFVTQAAGVPVIYLASGTPGTIIEIVAYTRA
jgi:hypothetical protein